jgi:hypothetical protein
MNVKFGTSIQGENRFRAFKKKVLRRTFVPEVELTERCRNLAYIIFQNAYPSPLAPPGFLLMGVTQYSKGDTGQKICLQTYV